MELILKSDNKTLEFVEGSQGINTGDINLNDDFVQVLVVRPEIELGDRESLAVVFELNGMDEYTKPMTFLETDGTYRCAIPDGVLIVGGEWQFTILRRRYRNTDKTGDFSQIASNTYSFEVSESVKANGTPITATMLQTLYDSADERATAAETARAEADKAKTAAAESAELAEVSANEAKAKADSIHYDITAVEGTVSTLEKEVEFINKVLTQGGIVYKADTETAYNERITADGLNVLDGSKAVLKKVVGSTVKSNNLIPFPYYLASGTTQRGVTLTYDENGVITLSGTNDSGQATSFALTDSARYWIKLKAGTYKYSQNVSYDICYGIVQVRNANGSFVANLSARTEESSVITIPQEYEDNGYQYNFIFVVQKDADVNGIVVKLMFNEGETALPYQPYFTGLKNASFAGIESTGRNLFKEPENYTNGMLQNEGIIDSNVNYHTTDYMAILGGLDFTISFDQTYAISSGTTSFRVVIYDKYKTVLSYFSILPTAIGRYSYTFTTPHDAVYYRIGTRLTDKDIMLNAGKTALPYEPYIEPTTLTFPKTETGEWNSIDFEGKKIVKGGETLTQDTEFTAEQLAEYSEYILSADGKSVRYKLATPTETPFANGNEYEVYSGGTENVLGNDNAEYVKNTLLQNYIVVKE